MSCVPGQQGSCMMCLLLACTYLAHHELESLYIYYYFYYYYYYYHHEYYPMLL